MIAVSTMEEFLASTGFRYLIFPLVSVILGVYVKYVTKNDRFARLQVEDMAVGMQLMLTAMLMYVLLTTDRALTLIKANADLKDALSSSPLNATKAMVLQTTIDHHSHQVSNAGWMIVLLLLSLWSVSTVVRKKGWKPDIADQLDPIIGVVMPLLVGLMMLVWVMSEASR